MSDKKSLTRLARHLLFEFNDKDVVDRFTLYDRPGPKSDDAEVTSTKAIQSTIGSEVPLKPSVLMATQNFAERPPVEDDEYLPANRKELSNAASVISSMVPPDQIKFFYDGLHDLYDAARDREGSVDEEDSDEKDFKQEPGDESQMNNRRNAKDVKTESATINLLRKLIVEMAGQQQPDMSIEDAIAYLSALNVKGRPTKNYVDYFPEPQFEPLSNILKKMGINMSADLLRQQHDNAVRYRSSRAPKMGDKSYRGPVSIDKKAKTTDASWRQDIPPVKEERVTLATLAAIFGYSGEPGVRQWAEKVKAKYDRAMALLNSDEGSAVDKNFKKLLGEIAKHMIAHQPEIFKELLLKHQKAILDYVSEDAKEKFEMLDTESQPTQLDLDVQSFSGDKRQFYVEVLMVLNDSLLRTLVGNILDAEHKKESADIEEALRTLIQNIKIGGKPLSDLLGASLRPLEDTLYNQITGGSAPDFENIKKRVNTLKTAANKLNDADVANILNELDKLFQKGTYDNLRYKLGIKSRDEKFMGNDVFENALISWQFEKDKNKKISDAAKATKSAIAAARKGEEEFKQILARDVAAKQAAIGSSKPDDAYPDSRDPGVISQRAPYEPPAPGTSPLGSFSRQAVKLQNRVDAAKAAAANRDARAGIKPPTIPTSTIAASEPEVSDAKSDAAARATPTRRIPRKP
jgi:hypothetical protein